MACLTGSRLVAYSSLWNVFNRHSLFGPTIYMACGPSVLLNNFINVWLLNNFINVCSIYITITLLYQDRYIVIRDTTGTLREGTWEERDCLCQTYMPRPGRKQWLPTLLSPTHLPGVLARGHHLHALELACAQCQPDSKDFIRVFACHAHLDHTHLNTFSPYARLFIYDSQNTTSIALTIIVTELHAS